MWDQATSADVFVVFFEGTDLNQRIVNCDGFWSFLVLFPVILRVQKWDFSAKLIINVHELKMLKAGAESLRGSTSSVDSGSVGGIYGSPWHFLYAHGKCLVIPKSKVW